MIIHLLAATRRRRGSRFPSDCLRCRLMYTVRTVLTSCAAAPVPKFLTVQLLAISAIICRCNLVLATGFEPAFSTLRTSPPKPLADASIVWYWTRESNPEASGFESDRYASSHQSSIVWQRQRESNPRLRFQRPFPLRVLPHQFGTPCRSRTCFPFVRSDGSYPLDGMWSMPWESNPPHNRI